MVRLVSAHPSSQLCQDPHLDFLEMLPCWLLLYLPVTLIDWNRLEMSPTQFHQRTTEWMVINCSACNRNGDNFVRIQ